MSVRNGWQFQCANTTCLPSNTFLTLNIRQCQTSCLSEIYCKAISFHRLATRCNLFDYVPDPNGNMVVDTDSMTMIVITETRIPREPTTTSTTTATTTTNVLCTSGGIPLTFDDIPNADDSQGPIPSNYGGLNWTSSSYINTSEFPSSGYHYVCGSGVYALCFDTTLKIETPVETNTVTLNSCRMAAGWSNSTNLTITGYYSNTQLYTITVLLNTYSAVLQVFNWLGLNKIVMQASGSAILHVGLDNLCITFGIK
ncbi:unnamed protein product [Adineta ricciae]|uniref:Apple domain-containing protein n=1 Tax=Adineta ricciae TaxID=249248 RepID=A0A816GSB2_ADIRI|nr:unnamed protein product [Adineta ricciae]